MKDKILVVDDVVLWFDDFEHLLGDEFTVRTASTVSEACKIIGEEIDLALLLVDLLFEPDDTVSGFEPAGLRILKFARRTRPQLPAFLVSSYGEGSSRSSLHGWGCEFFSKASIFAQPEEFKEKVRRTIRASQLGSRFSREHSVSADKERPSPEEILEDELSTLVDKYASVKNETLNIPNEANYKLLKPLVGFKREIEGKILEFPYRENVFLMMKFRDHNTDLADFIRDNLAKHGLRGVRADQPEWNITQDAYNFIAVLYCCKYGIAIFDEAEAGQAYNPNVLYELGMMHNQEKNCLILRHNSLPAAPFDFIKNLHTTYKKDLEVKRFISDWATQLVRSY